MFVARVLSRWLTQTVIIHLPIKILYSELDQWRNAETKTIKAAEVGERRKLALRELLHKETRLLQTIDRLKITAAHEGKASRGRKGGRVQSATISAVLRCKKN